MSRTDSVKATVEDLMALVEFYKKNKVIVDTILRRAILLRDRLEELGETAGSLDAAESRIKPLPVWGVLTPPPAVDEGGVDPVEDVPAAVEPEPDQDVPVDDPADPIYGVVRDTMPDARLLNADDAMFVNDIANPTRFFLVEHGMKWERYINAPAGFHPTPLKVTV